MVKELRGASTRRARPRLRRAFTSPSALNRKVSRLDTKGPGKIGEYAEDFDRGDEGGRSLFEYALQVFSE